MNKIDIVKAWFAFWKGTAKPLPKDWSNKMTYMENENQEEFKVLSKNKKKKKDKDIVCDYNQHNPFDIFR
mgnify:CR=1 FL=1